MLQTVSVGKSLATVVPQAPYVSRAVPARPDGSLRESLGGTLEFANVGPMRIGRFVALRRCELRHPVALTSDAPEFITLAKQARGNSVLEQFGRTMQLSAGDWTVCDAPRPMRSIHEPGAEQLHFLIPIDMIRMGQEVRNAMGRVYRSSSGVSALMCQTISTLFEQFPTLRPEQGQELAEVVARLFHLALLENRGPLKAASSHEEMRSRIMRHVDNRLRDSRLSLDQVAADLNCTKRYLHLVFADQQLTLSEYIWAQRLDRCRSDLLDPRMNDRSVTEVAMGWGFSNLSHFSRCFKERFGLSPRDARSKVLG